MVFYGSKASKLKEGQLINVKCPNCTEGQTMHYTIYGKYAYVYWIPLFPMGKTYVLECNHCKRTYNLKELPEQIKQKFELEKTGVRFPLWYFSGLIIITLAILVATYLSKKDDENDTLYINNPRIGDVYSVKASQTGYYTSMKVTTVTSDSIYVIFNDYEIDRKSKIYKINKTENYTTELDGYSKLEIKTLFEQEYIYEVDRD